MILPMPDGVVPTTSSWRAPLYPGIHAKVGLVDVANEGSTNARVCMYSVTCGGETSLNDPVDSH